MHEGASEALWADGAVVFSRRRRERESVALSAAQSPPLCPFALSPPRDPGSLGG